MIESSISSSDGLKHICMRYMEYNKTHFTNSLIYKNTITRWLWNRYNHITYIIFLPETSVFPVYNTRSTLQRSFSKSVRLTQGNTYYILVSGNYYFSTADYKFKLEEWIVIWEIVKLKWSNTREDEEVYLMYASLLILYII